MGNQTRFDVFFEQHVGIGIRWQTGLWSDFPVSLSIAVMCVTVVIGIGPRKQAAQAGKEGAE